MEAVCSRSLVSVRANSSRAETFEPLKKGCGVWLSKRSARRGRACQGSAAGLALLVPDVLARAADRAKQSNLASDPRFDASPELRVHIEWTERLAQEHINQQV